jgi:MFS family permease
VVAAAVSYRDLARHREFRALWLSQTLSRVGDQLAAVALSVLVYAHTGSTLATAATYAVGFLPALLGGPLLAGLADVLPRRLVMVACDLLRAGLVAGMAVPGMPLAALLPLLAVVGLAESAFSAARAATVADVLTGEAYDLASSATSMTREAALLGGFLVGGAAVSVVGARGCLLLDAASFLASAVLLRAVRHRPAARRRASSPRGLVDPRLAEGLRVVFADPRLRALALLAWTCCFYVVPEALAVPYAHRHGAGSTAAGVLLAATPAGAAVGAYALVRLAGRALRRRLMGPLAVLSCLALVPAAINPPWPVLAGLLAVTGIASVYNLPANAAFVQAVGNEHRAAAFGVVAAGMSGGQGLALLLGGAAAERLTSGAVIGLSGGLGAVLSAALTARLRHLFLTH